MDTEAIQIEQNVRFPVGRGVYPFGDMDLGDSFLLTTERRANAARVASIRYVKKYQPTWEFKVRKVEGGWRLWRIA